MPSDKPAIRSRTGTARLLSNTAYLASSQGITILVRMLYVVILARMLGPTGYGMFAYALSWYVLFMPLTSLGHGVILARELASASEKSYAIASATLSHRLAVSLLVLSTCLTMGWLLNSERDGQALVMLFSLAILPRALSLWSHAVFAAFERTRTVLAFESLFRSLEVLIGIALLLAGSELLLLAAAHVLLWTAQALISMAWVYRRHTRFRVRFGLIREYRLFRQGGALSLVYLANDWLVAGPVVLFRHLSDDTEALGLLALCCQVLGYLKLLPNTAVVSAQPALRRSIRSGGHDRSRFTRAFIRIVLLQSALLALLLGGLGESVITLVLGYGYLPALTPLMGVAWVAGALALSQLAQSLNALSYRLRPSLTGALLGVAGMLVTVLPLSAWNGFTGSLMAGALGIGLASLWNAVQVEADRHLVLPAVCGCLLAAALGFLLPLGMPNEWTALETALLSLVVAVSSLAVPALRN